MDIGRRAAKATMGAALCLVGLLTIPTTASAYVGPGAGLSVIGSILAFVAAVLLGVIGFIWYPLRRLLRSMRSRRAAAEKTGPGQDADA